MKKRKLKKKFVIFLSIYAVFFVSYFTITTLAKYTSLLNINGNVTVAKWDVSITGNNNQILPTMTIGKNSTYQNYNLSVTSTSEIAITYSVIITDVPTGVQVQIDNNTIYDEDNGTVTITNLGSFNANDNNTSHNHIITFIVPLGIDTFNNETMNIDVIFTQAEL